MSNCYCTVKNLMCFHKPACEQSCNVYKQARTNIVFSAPTCSFYLKLSVNIMRTLPADVEKDCISLLRNGASYSDISKNLGISKSVVSKIRKRNSIDLKQNKSGPAPKISSSTKRLLARKVSKGDLQNAVVATKYLNVQFGVKVEASTVRRALADEGLVAMKKVDKPRLTQKHIKERLRFAKNYVNWTTADWDRVVFSDETKINRFGSDGARWAYKRKGMPICRAPLGV
jgi:transposase